MAQPSTIPQQLMTSALLHFENGVPIDDCDVRSENKDRLARVDHVFWQWKRNPFLDTMALFRQLVKGKYANKSSAWVAAQKDKLLFDVVVAHVAPPSRREDEMKVRFAAERAIQIGADTDNAQALVKGGKLLYDVAGLDKPEDQRADMSKVAFMPTVVVTDIRQVDDTKDNYDDEETKRIIAKYGAHVDEKHKAIEDKVALMEARSGAGGKK
ncbi:MAG: hypothetical protein II495_00890, partial [Paludibacteraceae bacterium]|nr:hypothetical protein [Paludibacteraceae bacterium]